MAILVKYRETKKRIPGYWKGKVRISRDFDQLPESLVSAFRSEGTCTSENPCDT